MIEITVTIEVRTDAETIRVEEIAWASSSRELGVVPNVSGHLEECSNRAVSKTKAAVNA